ncbi:hypothetical protein ORM77_25370 [Bacillus cereus]|nr:hypothetical protein [Bacillus cereus]
MLTEFIEQKQRKDSYVLRRKDVNIQIGYLIKILVNGDISSTRNDTVNIFLPYSTENDPKFYKKTATLLDTVKTNKEMFRDNEKSLPQLLNQVLRNNKKQ